MRYANKSMKQTLRGYSPTSKQHAYVNVLDYSSDLNAINEAVMAWCGEDTIKERRFFSRLWELCDDKNLHAQDIYFRTVTAPARTRCEALVLAAGEMDKEATEA